jgi:protocatechuate 3,4-dioxygenase beta subunit
MPISRMSCALFIIAFLARICFPQAGANAVLVGRVTDERGAVVPSAHVTVRSVATNLVRSATTDENGYFQVAALPPRGLRSAG